MSSEQSGNKQLQEADIQALLQSVTPPTRSAWRQYRADIIVSALLIALCIVCYLLVAQAVPQKR